MSVFVLCCQSIRRRTRGVIMRVFVVCCQLQFSATDQGRPNECFRCVLSVRGLCDGPGES